MKKRLLTVVLGMAMAATMTACGGAAETTAPAADDASFFDLSGRRANDKSGIAKMRYLVGVDYKYQKKHVFGLTYLYQDVNRDDDDNEVNSHIIGLSYKYKF